MELKHHIYYNLLMTIVVCSLIYLGNQQIELMQNDYNLKLNTLKQELKTDINVLDQTLDQTAKEYNLQIGQLEKTTQQFKSQIQDLEYSSDMYKEQIGQLDQQVTDLQVESESFTNTISKVIDSVVSIHTDVGLGSGAIISENGLVITNHHVIAGATSASIVTYNGNIYNVELIGYNVNSDLALLKIVSDKTFQYFEFEDSDELKIGQKVVALGNPAGLSFTATEGIISSPNRVMSNGLSFIQTDVTLNPGNSGGPLIDVNGKIIGIVDFKIAEYEELGFAIPSNRIISFVNEVLE